MMTFLLQATGAAAPLGGLGDYNGIIMMVLMVAIFYFFMIRPQQKKQKEIRNFRDSLQVGQKVVTAGGVYGRIRDIKENTISLEIAENVRIQIDRTSIFASAEDTAESK